MLRRSLGVLGVIGAAGLVGCHTEVLPPLAPAPLSACLTFVVQDDLSRSNAYDRVVQNAVRTSTEVALVGAGFNVLDDPTLPHDLVARMVTTPGSRVESNAKVDAKLVLESQGKVVAELDAKAPQETPGYEGAIADQLVDQVFRSPELAAFTRELRKPESKKHLAASALRASAAAPGSPAASSAAPTVPVPAALAPDAAAPPAISADEMVQGATQPEAYALIVGVEQYKGAPPSPGAKADAERFAHLARRTLGVPDAHIKIVLGEKADKLAFDLTLEWLKLNVHSGGRIYFFFSGRGALRRQTSTEFLLPFDADVQALDKTAVALPAFLLGLSQTKAKDVLVLVDTSFSGLGDRSMLPSDAAIPKIIGDPEIPPRVAVLSAVSSAETALASGPGGLFTRYVIDGLGKARADIDGDGQISLQELVTWAGPRVAREAKRAKGAQTPELLVGPGVGQPAQIAVAAGLPSQ